MSRLEVLNPESPRRALNQLCALGIMTKAPEPGKVKTRLSPPLTPAEAATLNTCFLRDLSRSIAIACQEVPAQGVAVYTPVGSEACYETILPANFFLIAQRGETFGERLTFAVNDLLAVGFKSVCLINSDSPSVPSSSFAEAASELAKPGDRIVLGPSEDGGYYLIGLKQLHRRIFENIDWSTARVFEQTVKRAGEIGAAVHELPSGLDVDDRASLVRLYQRLSGPHVGDVAPATRSFLRELTENDRSARLW